MERLGESILNCVDNGLAGRLANRVQLTSDGHKPYLQAVDLAFAGEVD